MFRLVSRKFRLACVAALVVATATPLTAGPPWISIELPGNPYDQNARDAFLVVHAFHHGEPVALPVKGTAEGMVNGQRKTIQLDFQKTSRAGAFGVKKQWTDGTVWVLAFTVTQAKDDEVSALVTIAADGRATRVETLTKRGENGMVLPRQLARSDVDAAFRAAGATASN